MGHIAKGGGPELGYSKGNAASFSAVFLSLSGYQPSLSFSATVFFLSSFQPAK
jgi:hypothetical protein